MKNLFYLLITVMVFLLSCQKDQKEEKITEPEVIDLSDTKWDFVPGDSMAYAEPDFNTNGWDDIEPITYWERLGYSNYDGYAWYRKEFHLPKDYLEHAYLSDSLSIVLGKIDDTDQTYLNGILIGQNGRSVKYAKSSAAEDFEGNPDSYNFFREYVIPADHPAINWDGTNVLAIRVHDHGGNGGFASRGVQQVSIKGIKNYLNFDLQSQPYQLKKPNEFRKDILLENSHPQIPFSGRLRVTVIDRFSNEKVMEDVKQIDIKPGIQQQYSYVFNVDQTKPQIVRYEFRQNQAVVPVVHYQELPYILTPPEKDTPAVNGPGIYGVGLKKKFIFSIPVSGVRPIRYSFNNLPAGVEADTSSGIIEGKIDEAGDYDISVIAENSYGKDSSRITIKVGSGIALTPPMGWNSWNCWGLSVSAEKVKEAADYMVSSGLKDYGWSYVNIDDGWEADERTNEGILEGNDNFPDMKALADYVHSKGLKIGIYSSPGPRTCGDYLGSYMYEKEDAETWARWGIDYLKYDWCSYSEIAKNRSLDELKKPYRKMHNMLQLQNRDIVYSLCQYGMGDVWKWGDEVGGNLWRTTGDIVDTWLSVYDIGFSQYKLAEYAQPGHWNDPDMLVLGWVGWGPNLHPTRLTISEQYSHMSLWALLSAPLLLGNDLSRLDDFTLGLLKNDEVIAVNQDALGAQAERVLIDDDIQIWKKKLHDGSLAIGIFNLGNEDTEYTLDFKDIGLRNVVKIRDLWRKKDMGEFEDDFETVLFKHGVKLLRIEQ